MAADEFTKTAKLHMHRIKATTKEERCRSLLLLSQRRCSSSRICGFHSAVGGRGNASTWTLVPGAAAWFVGGGTIGTIVAVTVRLTPFAVPEAVVDATAAVWSRGWVIFRMSRGMGGV